ncbi:MAG: hypothetical protein ACTHKQ_24880 [Mesorhizobium sp.]
MRIHTCGSTRTVVLIGAYAIKIPGAWRWPRRYRSLLNGLLANASERDFGKAGWDGLCPLTFSLPGGWLNVMRRAEPLSRDEWFAFDRDAFIDRGDWILPVEDKMDSFGKLNGRIVAVDYG